MNNKENKNTVEIALQQLRPLVQDLIDDDKCLGEDLNLLRWLKACDLNVKKAERMMRSSIKWRKENEIDLLKTLDYHPVLNKSIPFETEGHCRDGVPIASIEGGKVDLKGLVDAHGKEEVYRYCIQKLMAHEQICLDWNKEMAKKRNNAEPITEKSIDGYVFIIDCKNVSLRQLSSIKTIHLITQICRDYISYVPVLGSRIILINCNRLAHGFISIIKPILESSTLTVEVHDTNTDKWKGVLLKRIDPSEIGVAFGGNRVVAQTYVKYVT